MRIPKSTICCVCVQAPGRKSAVTVAMRRPIMTSLQPHHII